MEPLGSIRVLELTTSIAGPYCGLILAALGADVIKLEPPGRGDDTRSWGPPFWNGESATFLSMNAGKRSIVVDLKNTDGVRAAKRLADSVDVVVENLRPGLVERLGLGFADLSRSNDRLVYCSVGAFGKRGPLAEEPGYDPLMQAAGGIMSITGEPGREPVRAGASIVDQGSGMWAAIGILAALRRRDAGGGAQAVDLSLYETAVNWIPYQLVGFLASGRAPRPMGSGIEIIAPYEAFATRDGWLMIAAGNDRLFRSLCESLGHAGVADDPRFRTNADRVANRGDLSRLIAAWVGEESSAAIVARLRKAGVPVAPVQDVSQVAASEQTEALGLLQHVPHADAPDLKLVAPPISFDGDRLAYASPPPALGAHSLEVLAEAEFDEGEVDELLRSGAVVQRSPSSP